MRSTPKLRLLRWLVLLSVQLVGMGQLSGCFLGDVFGGNLGMGELCDSSDQCGADGGAGDGSSSGTCLAGVCEGYACQSDQDCDGDHVCADIAGVSVCAESCQTVADCQGTQSCVDQEQASYCL